MLFFFIGYSFSTLIFGHSVLMHLENSKEALVNAYIVPLFYFPLLVIASVLLYSRLYNHISDIETEKRLTNPRCRAEDALELLKHGLPTGYPQAPQRPNFLVQH